MSSGENPEMAQVAAQEQLANREKAREVLLQLMSEAETR